MIKIAKEHRQSKEQLACVTTIHIARSIGSYKIRVNGARASNQVGIRVHHFLDDYFGSSFGGSCYQSKIIIFFVNIASEPNE